MHAFSENQMGVKANPMILSPAGLQKLREYANEIDGTEDAKDNKHEINEEVHQRHL